VTPIRAVRAVGRAGYHAAVRMIAALLIAWAAMACSPAPRRYNLELQWKNDFTWQDARTGAGAARLTSEEIDALTIAAHETLVAAFAGLPAVSVSAAGKVSDPIEVRNLQMFALAETGPCGLRICGPSRINYDLHRDFAQTYGGQLHITDRRDVIRAIGRGIGNTAAHEFGHRHHLPGMDQTSDPLAFTYADGHPSLFYGARLSWPAGITEVLSHR
jgi:hypothetical protein